MIIELPWPHKWLSPNARKHWAAVAPVKARAKADAHLLTQVAMRSNSLSKAHFDGEGRIPMQIRFYPPDKRHRDDDNMIGSIKAARDGIADALGANDRRFNPHYFFCDPVKGGRVEVELAPVANCAG